MKNTEPQANNNQSSTPDVTARWDAIPRDGPAVFVIGGDAATLSGDWIDPTGETEQVASAVESATGQPADSDRWSVIDQIGLGPVMLPEHLTIRSLVHLARAHRSVQ